MPSAQPSNSSESASEKVTAMKDGASPAATEPESSGAIPGRSRSVSHALLDRCEVETQAHTVHSSKFNTAVAAAQSGPVSQGAKATDLPTMGSQHGTAGILPSASLNVQAVQQASCSDREGRDAATEQSDTT